MLITTRNLVAVIFFFSAFSLSAQSWVEKANDSQISISTQVEECHNYGTIMFKVENLSQDAQDLSYRVTYDSPQLTIDTTIIINDIQAGEVIENDCLKSVSGESQHCIILFNQEVVEEKDIEVEIIR